MPAAILVIEYELGELQQAMSLDAWQDQARQIALMPGLEFKYWLRRPEGGRGGVYLFESAQSAEDAAQTLVKSLRDAGAQNVVHRCFDVDPVLSEITKARLPEGQR